MTAVFPLLVGGFTLLYTGLFAAQTSVRSGALTARSRIGLAVAAVDALLSLVLAHVLLPWSSVPTALWLLPIGITALGVAGAVLRWSALPAVKPDGDAKRQIASGVVHMAVAGAVTVLVLLL